MASFSLMLLQVVLGQSLKAALFSIGHFVSTCDKLSCFLCRLYLMSSPLLSLAISEVKQQLVSLLVALCAQDDVAPSSLTYFHIPLQAGKVFIN